MGVASYLQSSFLGGMWSNFMQGRADHPKYTTAMAQCLNAFPVEEGACVRRPGFLRAAHTRAGSAGRVIPFEFVENNPYTMEFTDSHLRLFSGTQLVYDPPFKVLSISAATPAVVTTDGANGYARGDEVIFPIQLPTDTMNAAGLMNRQFVLIPTSSTTFSINDAVSNEPFDGSTLVGGGTGLVVARIVDLLTPYTNGAWKNIVAVPAQSANQLSECFLFCPGFKPWILTAVAPPQGDNPFYSFALSQPVFLDGPYEDPIQSTTCTAGSTGGGTILMTIASAVPINSGEGFVATDIGRMMRFLNEPAQWDAGVTYHNGDEVSWPTLAAVAGQSGTNYYTMVDNGTTPPPGQQPDLHPEVWSLTPEAAYWTWGTIASRVDSFNVNVTIVGGGINHPVFSTFQMGAMSDTTGYAACGTFHEGRLWLGGLFANRFDASVSNDPLTFSPTAPDGAVLDSSAFTENLNSADTNMIYWMQPDHLGIICGTLSGEWLIQASTLSDPLTPTSIQAHRVTKYGCANIRPVRTGISLVFVQKFKHRCLEFLADVFTGKFIAPNLSLTAKNLAQSGIEELAYQEELTPIIWARCGDGSLIGATYRRISAFTTEEPAFVGWHKHALGSGRNVESICVGPTRDGLLDALTMVTNDPDGVVRSVDVMTKLFDEDDLLTDAFFLDSATVPAAARVDATNGVTLYGLQYANGKTMSAFVGGLDCGDYLVANGSITIPWGVAGGYFSQAYLSLLSGSNIHFTNAVTDGAMQLTFPAVVGFTFTTQGQVLRPLAPGPTASGAQVGAALGKTRRVVQFSALLNNCINGGIQFGTTFTNMHVANLTSPSGVAYTPVQMVSGVQWDTLEDDYSFDGMLAWQVTRPYPATICAIEGFLQTMDR